MRCVTPGALALLLSLSDGLRLTTAWDDEPSVVCAVVAVVMASSASGASIYLFNVCIDSVMVGMFI